MILPNGLTTQEIRVLQEFRRKGQERLTIDEIKAISHPSGGGDAPAFGLAEKGYLSAEEGGTAFALTARATELLAYDPKP